MNTAIKKQEPETHTFLFTVQVDPFWVEYLTQYNDVFNRGSAGYWLRGIEMNVELGWLCWEDDEQHDFGDEPDREEAFRAWEAGEPLPEHWFRIDRAAALRAWEEGVKRWGVDWYEQTDADREDTVLQLALLGKTVYG